MIKPLSQAKENEILRIVSIEGGKGFTVRLINMGFHRNAVIQVIKSGRPGPFILLLHGTRLALGYGMTKKIQVREIKADNR